MIPRLAAFDPLHGLLATQCLRQRIKPVRWGYFEPRGDRWWRWDSDRGYWAPAFDPLIVERHAAVAYTTSNPAGRTSETQNNSFTLDATGADFLVVNLSGIDAGFAGIANQISSGPTFNSNAGTQLAIITGGDGANGAGAWGWNDSQLPTTTATFTVNFTDSSFAGGPKIGYGFLSGVHQGASPSNSVRTTGQDNSLGTSISIALTGLTSGDFCIWWLHDYLDSAHTPSTLTENFESTTNDWTLAWGTLTADATSETAGWTGATSSSGLALALIPASATAYSISAESASYAWTGQTAALLKASKVSAESASYDWAGQDATLVRQFTLSAEAAAYSWAGQVASLLSAFKLSGESASYSWTGASATLSKSFILSAIATAWEWAAAAVSFIAPIWQRPADTDATWTEQADTSKAWSAQSNTSSTWNQQADTSKTWTEQSNTPKTWTEQ